MGDKTGIQWTQSDDGTPGATWNPTTGCDRVSPGCDHCYALTQARRLRAMGQAKYQTDGDPRTSGPGFGLAVHPDALMQPLRWKRPRRIFVNSMSDLFHDKVRRDFILQVFAVMAVTPHHTYQVLTKRHARMRSLLSGPEFADDVWALVWQLDGGIAWRRRRWPLPNVWLGVSVEDQKWADIRIPALLDTPAAVRFLSCEPLLGPVDLREWLTEERDVTDPHLDAPLDAVVDGMVRRHDYWIRQSFIRWVICGGESGPGARPMVPDWARSLRDQCSDAGVPFFFKQWGQWAPTGCIGDGVQRAHQLWVGPPRGDLCEYEEIRRVGKHAAGRELDGRTWDEFPRAAEAVSR